VKVQIGREVRLIERLEERDPALRKVAMAKECSHDRHFFLSTRAISVVLWARDWVKSINSLRRSEATSRLICCPGTCSSADNEAPGLYGAY